MKLPPLPFVVLDTETTGFVPRVHKIIEFASVRIDRGKIVDTYEQLFFDAEVPPHVEALTHIKTAALKDQPKFDDRRNEILSKLPADTLLVGQNLGFDLGMLKGHGIDLTDRPWVDTSMLASLVFPELESYSLGYLSTVLQLPHEPQHRALGDVHATLALLEKVWARLQELPKETMDKAKATMAKSGDGYKLLFGHLDGKATKTPAWLHMPMEGTDERATVTPLELPAVDKGDVTLAEEPLDPDFLQAILAEAKRDDSRAHWIAVKNLDAALRRMPRSMQDEKKSGVRVLYAAHQLLDHAAATQLRTQDIYTHDEATLALKLEWYKPHKRSDLPLHGGEEAVWNGKLACTVQSKEYRAQFDSLPKTILCDHRQLLELAFDPDHPGAAALNTVSHVIIDDASMLEDTATKAYGWHCFLDEVRAAAEGNPLLTKFLDLFQLWIETVRQFQDLRYLSISDLKTPEARGLREQLDAVLVSEQFSQQTLRQLDCLRKMLESENLANRIAWIEQRQNGSQSLHSVPERVGLFLHEHLFSRQAVTLLIPPKTADLLPEILPSKQNLEATRYPLPVIHLPISFPSDLTVDAILADPPAGKTIVLLPGKGAIEDMFVKHKEALEARGVTLICQGMSGGQGRMQAEFHAATGTTLWLLTPWTFEGIDLPPASVDQLVLRSLPFDHPSHAVLSRRALHYRDAFNDYLLPRLLHRLFRLLRTFTRFRRGVGDVLILDERLFTKGYGKKVQQYLDQFAEGEAAPGDRPPALSRAEGSVAAVKQENAVPKESKSKKSVKPKSEKKPKKDQLSMF